MHKFTITPTQYGFRYNYSTTHAILGIVFTCYDNIESKNYWLNSNKLTLDTSKSQIMIISYKLNS